MPAAPPQSPIQFPDQVFATRVQSAFVRQHIGFVETVQRALPDLDIQLKPLGGGAFAAYAGPSIPFTRVSGIGVTEPATAAQFEAAERFYTGFGTGGGGEPCRVEVCPLASQGLIELVRDRGYVLNTFTNLYFRAPPGPDELLEPPAGVRVEAVDPGDVAAADRGLRVIHRGFAGPDAAGPEDRMWRMVRNAFPRPGTMLFTAHVGDVDGPIAGGTMEYVELDEGSGGGVIACLSGAATHEQHRRRGAQTALIRARLAHVRDQVSRGLKCDLAVIQTRPGIVSERNIIRHGFRLAYTRPQMIRPAPAR